MAAAGTLITLPGTGPNDLTMTQQADWKKWSRALSDAGLAAFKASENKDMQGARRGQFAARGGMRELP